MKSCRSTVQQKYVVDKYGRRHAYDKLILATGTRAFIPKDAPIHLPGIFTMRTRPDADRLRSHLKPGGQVIIIGGGLLGLELAVALREINIQVSVIQMSSRSDGTANGQPGGSSCSWNLLKRKVWRYTSTTRCSRWYGMTPPQRLRAGLRSGKTIQAHALVYAVGTRPNIEFAQEAGVETRTGYYCQRSSADQRSRHLCHWRNRRAPGQDAGHYRRGRETSRRIWRVTWMVTCKVYTKARCP